MPALGINIATRSLSGLNSTTSAFSGACRLKTGSVISSELESGVTSVTSQIRTGPSWSTVASHLPSGLKVNTIRFTIEFLNYPYLCPAGCIPNLDLLIEA